MANAEELHHRDVSALVALISMVKIKFMDTPEIYKTLLAFLCDYDPEQPDSRERTLRYIRLLITDEVLANCIVMSLPEGWSSLKPLDIKEDSLNRISTRPCVNCTENLPKNLETRQTTRVSPNQLDTAPGVKSICHLPPATAIQTVVGEDKKVEPPPAAAKVEPAPCSTVTQGQEKVTQSSTNLPATHSPGIINCNRGQTVSQIKPYKQIPVQPTKHRAEGSKKTPAPSTVPPNPPIVGAWPQGQCQTAKGQGQVPTTRTGQAFTPPVGMMLQFPYSDYRLPLQGSQFTGMQPVIGQGNVLPWQYTSMAGWRGQAGSSESSLDLSMQNQPVDLTGHGKKAAKSATPSHSTGQNKLKRSVSSTSTSAADRNGSSRPKLQKMHSDSVLDRPAGIIKDMNNDGLEKKSGKASCTVSPITPLGSLYDLVSAIEVREDMKSIGTSKDAKTGKSEPTTRSFRVADNSDIKKSFSFPATEQAKHLYPTQKSSPANNNIATATAFFSSSNKASRLVNNVSATQVNSNNLAQINSSIVSQLNSNTISQNESNTWVAAQVSSNTSTPTQVNQPEAVSPMSDNDLRAFPYSQKIHLPNGKYSVVNLQRENMASPANPTSQAPIPQDFQPLPQMTWNRRRPGPIAVTRRSCSLSDILQLAQSESVKTLSSPVTSSEQSSDGVTGLKSVVTEATKSGNSTTLKIKLSNSEKLLGQILKMQQAKVYGNSNGNNNTASVAQSHNGQEARASATANLPSGKKTYIDQTTDPASLLRNERPNSSLSQISSSSQGMPEAKDWYATSSNSVGIVTLSGNGQPISTSTQNFGKAEQVGVKSNVQTIGTPQPGSAHSVMNMSPALQVFSTSTMGQAFAIQPKPDFAANTISVTDKAFLQTIKQRLHSQTKQQRALSDSALLSLYSRQPMETLRAGEQIGDFDSGVSQMPQNSGFIGQAAQTSSLIGQTLQNGGAIGQVPQNRGIMEQTLGSGGILTARSDVHQGMYVHSVSAPPTRPSLPDAAQVGSKADDDSSSEEEDDVFTEATIITDSIMACPLDD